MTEEKIARINELFHKSKEQQLTEDEKLEQQQLRAEYMDSVRTNLRSQLNNISVVEADGSVTDLGEKHGRESEQQS